MITYLDKKLVRKRLDGYGWWYTLRYVESTNHILSKSIPRSNFLLTKECCFDSKVYTNYRDCMRNATKHYKELGYVMKKGKEAER